jgi:hypothetical protein
VQSTLLGIAIAIIVVLVAALVGPLFIDWEHYRSTFETAGSRLVGAPVRINGKIDLRILPSPMLTLHDVEIGPPGGLSDIRAQGLDMELALGPLVRGQWRAASVHLTRPEVGLHLDPAGRLEALPIAAALDPDQVVVDHLVVDNGKLTLSDGTSGSVTVLDQIWFNGSVRSLEGPVQGEGAFVTSGQLYGYRIGASRRGDDGSTKLRFRLDPADRPLALETEGTLWIEDGAPRYEGNVTVSRPVGLAVSGGKKLVSEPWKLSSHIRANTDAALLEQLEFQYGPEEGGIKLSGTADVKFGVRPRLDGVLSARQVDLDRSFARGDETGRLPLATLRSFAAGLGDAIRPPIPVRLGIGVDTLTLGGAPLQNVRGDLASDAAAWNLQTFEFHAPGGTEVKLSGRLKVTPTTTEFVGPAAVDSADPSSLVAWIEGLSEPPNMAMGSLRVRGDVTLGNERVAFDRLTADADHKSFNGRIAYAFATPTRPARLDAALSATDIDVDAAIMFANAALAGSKFDKPGEIALALDVARLTYAGVAAKHATANIEVDPAGVRIERLAIADLAGANLNASGRIDSSSAAPRGALALDLDAPKLDGVAAMAAQALPSIADKVQAFAQHAAPAKLSATLNVEPLAGEPAKSAAKLIVDGRLGAARVNLIADASGALAMPSAADTRLEADVDADDSNALVGLMGLDHTLAIDHRPGHITLLAGGSLGSELRVDGKIAAAGLDTSLSGTMRLGEQGRRANLDLSASAADVVPLRRDASPVPATLKTKIVAAADNLSFRDFVLTIAGSPVRGQLGLTLGKPIRLDGHLAAESIDIPTVVGAFAGAPSGAPVASANGLWSGDPFTVNPLPGLEGAIPFYAVRATLAPGLAMQQVRGTLHVDPMGIALEDGEGTLAGGHVVATGSLRHDDGAIAARAKISVNGADLAALNGGAAAQLAGHLSLDVEVGGSGLSPAALVGALAGSGSVSVEGGQISGFDPAAIDTTIAAVDHGLPVDSPKVSDVISAALAVGKLNVRSASAPVTISSGRLRLASLGVPAQDASVSLNGFIDLGSEAIDARATLVGALRPDAPDGLRPELSIVLKGPVSAPTRSVDTASFIGWLTLRAVDRETKRLEDIQSKEPKSGGSPASRPLVHDGVKPQTPPAASAKPAAPSKPLTLRPPESQATTDPPAPVR